MASTYINLPNVVTGPNTSTVGNLAAYGVTNGSVLTDSGVSAAGVVVGPASSVDNTIPRFDGITGKLLQTSRVIIDDSDNLILPDGGATGKANIKFTTTANMSYDTNLIYTDSTTKTMGMLCGSTVAFSATYGPYLGMRGTTYSAIASQRGLLFLSAGNPIGALAGEGEIRLLTGADSIRVKVGYTGLVTVGSHTGVGQLDVKSGSVSVVPLIVDTQAAHATDVLQLKINGTSKAVMTSAGKFVVGGTATLGNSTGMFISGDGSYTPIAIQCTSVAGYAQLDMYSSASANVGGFGYGNPSAGAVITQNRTYFYSVARDFHISTNSNVTRHMVLAASTGAMSLSNLISNGGAVTALTITSAAHTAQTASTEIPSLYLNFAATRTWATGAIAAQSEVKIMAPTYAFAGASTITNAATLMISGAPVAGANATITNNYAFYSVGLNRFDGNGTHILELPADATLPTVLAGRLPVKIGGSTMYIPYYSA